MQNRFVVSTQTWIGIGIGTAMILLNQLKILKYLRCLLPIKSEVIIILGEFSSFITVMSAQNLEVKSQ